MKCEKCGADNLPGTQYCEACGHELGTPSEAAAAALEIDDEPETEPLGNPEDRPAKPGSLRDEIPFLTGAVDQAKARFQGWQQKKARQKTEKVREEEYSGSSSNSEPAAPEQSSFMSKVMGFLVGILALALFIYLLIRFPGKSSPAQAWALAESLCRFSFTD